MWRLLAWQVSNYNSHNPKSTSVVCPVGIDQKDPMGRSVFSPRIETAEERSERQREVRRWKQRERNFLHSSPNWISEPSQRPRREDRFERCQEQMVVGCVRHLQEPCWALLKGWLQRKCGRTEEMFLVTSYDRVLENFIPEQNLVLKDSKPTWPKY